MISKLRAKEAEVYSVKYYTVSYQFIKFQKFKCIFCIDRLKKRQVDFPFFPRYLAVRRRR